MDAQPEKTTDTIISAVKPKRVRQMTPELLEKLKLARERAKELRDMARGEKEKLVLPEPEKSKVAKYLATRKMIKNTLQKEIEEELETEIFEPKSEVIPPPVPEEKNFASVPPPVKDQRSQATELKVKAEKVEKVEKAEKKIVVVDSESDDEYTTIKIRKSKLVKYAKGVKEVKVEKVEPPAPVAPVAPAKWINPYSTGHLYNLAAGGYRF
jgi:hypothetical protein